MILRIGNNEKSFSIKKGTVTALYVNGKVEVINVENVKFVYLNHEQVQSVTVIEESK